MKDIDFRTQPPAEREWQAQERGEGTYAHVNRAAAQPIEVILPMEFAERVAATAQARANALRQPARFESWLIALLLIALVAGGAAFIATDSRSLESLRQPWLLGLAGCLALSQGMAWLFRPGRRGG